MKSEQIWLKFTSTKQISSLMIVINLEVHNHRNCLFYHCKTVNNSNINISTFPDYLGVNISRLRAWEVDNEIELTVIEVNRENNKYW